MDYYVGNIWDLADKGYVIVIPTNIGWNKYGKNVMGAGLAKEALKRTPGIDITLGAFYKQVNDPKNNLLYYYNKLLFFPTKELNRSKPWLSWQSDSSIELIKKQLTYLGDWTQNNRPGSIAIPLIGTGCGKLQRKVVKRLIEEQLGSLSSITLVIPANLEEELILSVQKSENKEKRSAKLLSILSKSE